jgi:hypothetical protein
MSIETEAQEVSLYLKFIPVALFILSLGIQRLVSRPVRKYIEKIKAEYPELKDPTNK